MKLNSEEQEMHLKFVGNWVNPRFERYELILLVAFLIGIVLSTFLEFNVLLNISLSAFSILFFLKSVGVGADSKLNASDKVIHRIIFYLLAISMVGILFRLNRWNGMLPLSMIGGGGLFIMLVVVMVMKIRNRNAPNYDKRFLKRMIYVAAMTLTLLLSALYQLNERNQDDQVIERVAD